MTKYILHGGETSRPSEHNDNFFKEIIKDLPEPIKVLNIYFASPQERWESSFADDQKKFAKAAEGKEVQLTMASEDLDVLQEQIKAADAVYIRGGKLGHILRDKLRSLGNFAELIKDKTMAGSSAGVNVLSNKFYKCTEDAIDDGMSILPANVVVHYQGEAYKFDGDKVIEDLKQLNDLETYPIRETEFIVIEK